MIQLLPGVFGILNNDAFPTRERNLYERPKITLFAPTNGAIFELLARSINELFDAEDLEVVEFFESIQIDVTDDNATFDDFLLSLNGRLILNEILLTHIIADEISSNMLKCNKMYDTFSGQESVTMCLQNSKFQVGEGNTAFVKPRVFATDTPASNGIIQVVDQVILPKLSIPKNFIPLPVDHEGTTILNSALLAGNPMIFTPDPTESP